MVLLIDNYDSFTYNLYQMAGAFYQDIHVVKNDELTVEDIKRLPCSHIILSPGPGRPHRAGICEDIVRYLSPFIPTLGICLGHQAICEAFGATITYASTLMHGKQSNIHVANGNPIFQGLPPMIAAARYHSLAVKRDTLPDELLVIAEDDCGEVMGIQHKEYNIYGLQFHPESILTKNGDTIIQNFLRIGGAVID